VLDAEDTGIDTIVQTADSVQLNRDAVIQKVDSSGLKLDFELSDGVLIDSSGLVTDTLIVDSLATVPDTALVAHPFHQNTVLRDLFIHANWEEKSTYRITFLPGAIMDMYGRQNDSLSFDFKTAGLDEFGSITINLSGLDSAQSYVVLLKLNDEIIKKTLVSAIDSTNNKIRHKHLKVNTYSIELIKDDNHDGKWTTGDYWLKRQPEESKTFTLDKLRENWDLEADVFWNESILPGLDTTGIKRDSLSEGENGQGLEKKQPDPKIDRSGGDPKILPDPKGKND
jgi:hypothetical protein